MGTLFRNDQHLVTLRLGPQVANMSASSGAGVNGVSRQSVLDNRIQQLERSYRNAVADEMTTNFGKFPAESIKKPLFLTSATPRSADRLREVVWQRIYARRPDFVVSEPSLSLSNVAPPSPSAPSRLPGHARGR